MDQSRSRLPETGFIRIEHLIGNKEKNIQPLFPFSRAKLYKLIQDGKFPAPDKRFGDRIAVWNVRDILNIIDGEG